METGNYNGSYAALNNMNALLTEEYRINVSTDAYNSFEDEVTLCKCKFCKMDREEIIHEGEEDERKKIVKVPTEFRFSSIKIIKVIAPFIDSILTGKESELVWYCPECKAENKVSETEKPKVKRERPYYRKVVKDCPTRQAGITGRMTFDTEYDSYAWNFSEELENTLSKYRIEYIAQNGHDMEDLSGFKDKGDSE